MGLPQVSAAQRRATKLVEEAVAEYEAAPGPMQKNLVRMTMLPEQDRPVSVQKSEIETWWKGQAYEDWPMEVS